MRFGRGELRLLDEPAEDLVAKPRLSDNVRLFAMTFSAGFLFVSILIG